MVIHFTLLLLALSALSASAAEFVSIDCGASGIYKDENSIEWTGDENVYIKSGESHEVQFYTVSHVMDTLRAFTAQKKNCYSIKAVKGERFLVRASFFYGNYDDKSSPPTFELQLNGIHWATVVTFSNKPVDHEAIFVVNGDSISVCVEQTFLDQYPFISAIEVRSLGAHMYNHVDSNHVLFLKSRVACGSDKSIRYPEDAYDRIWDPTGFLILLSKVKNEASVIDVNVENNPPSVVLQNAIASLGSYWGIELTNGLSQVEVPVYINLYFSEVAQLNSTQKRSFEMYINDKRISEPIIPPYGSVSEIYFGDITASSNTNFTLMPTRDSTLPAIINAYEIFSVSNAGNGTVITPKAPPTIISPKPPSPTLTPLEAPPTITSPEAPPSPTIISPEAPPTITSPKAPPSPTIASPEAPRPPPTITSPKAPPSPTIASPEAPPTITSPNAPPSPTIASPEAPPTITSSKAPPRPTIVSPKAHPTIISPQATTAPKAPPSPSSHKNGTNTTFSLGDSSGDPSSSSSGSSYKKGNTLIILMSGVVVQSGFAFWVIMGHLAILH